MKDKWPKVHAIPSYLKALGFKLDKDVSKKDDPKYGITDTSPVNMHLLKMHCTLLQSLCK